MTVETIAFLRVRHPLPASAAYLTRSLSIAWLNREHIRHWFQKTLVPHECDCCLFLCHQSGSMCGRSVISEWIPDFVMKENWWKRFQRSLKEYFFSAPTLFYYTMLPKLWIRLIRTFAMRWVSAFAILILYRINLHIIFIFISRHRRKWFRLLRQMDVCTSSVTLVHPAKAAGRKEMPFCRDTCVVQSNIVDLSVGTWECRLSPNYFGPCFILLCLYLITYKFIWQLLTRNPRYRKKNRWR